MENHLRRYRIYPEELDEDITPQVIPLGACKIMLNEIELGETLKSEQTKLSITTFSDEIKTEESSEVKEILEIGKDIKFETTLLCSKENFEKLNLNEDLDSLILSGRLKIVTVDENVTITIPKARIVIEISFELKEKKMNKIKLKARALRNYDKKIIKIKLGGIK